jgi:7-cyano-7-deazaguanine reductase
MASIRELQERYEKLDERSDSAPEAVVDAECLMAFDYDYTGQGGEVVVDTDEFTAVCPWTSLPDFGTLTVKYEPDGSCIELKSLKYYLLSYRGVGIVQEHAAHRILNDLVAVCQPVNMTVTLDYKVRGGLHTTATVRYEKP